MAAAKIQRGRMMKKLSNSISELLNSHRKSQGDLDDSTTSLHQAALMGNLQMMRMVLQSGLLPVDVQDSKGFAPLHYAALQGNPDISSTLLKYGARTDIKNMEGITPLHLACQQGELDTLSIFLYYRADVSVRSKCGRTPFDLACEFGRTKVVQHLLDSGLSKSFLFFPTSAGTPPGEKEKDLTNATFVKRNRQETTGFHLAAKNGHVEILAILLDNEWDVNRATPSGTALHDATQYGQVDSVRFLLHAGADPTAINCYGQTPSDVAKKHSGGKNSAPSKEIRALLKEASKSVYGKAILDYCALNSEELSFNYGDVIWILDRSQDDRWKGVIFGPKFHSRSGYFPPSAVQLIDKQVGMQRSTSHRQVKKCTVPVVPDVSSGAGGPPGVGVAVSGPLKVQTTPLHCSTISAQSTSSYGSMDGALASPSSPLHTFKAGGNAELSMMNGNVTPKLQQQPTIHVTSASGSLSNFVPTMTSSPNHLCPTATAGGGGRLVQVQGGTTMDIAQPLNCAQMQLTGGQQVVGSPRHRNSTGSNSSQASSGFESMKSSSQPQVNATVHTLRGDSPPSRNSVHSSGSSSLGSSLERLDESGYASQVNISEMIMNGIPDQEVIGVWLHELRYEDYLPLFLNAGYDLPTVARMTPEDLTAIGITKPGHRKRLTTEIHKLTIGDPWPPRPPPGGLREWLAAGLQLPEYVPLFESQGYTSLDQVMQLTWEDFEDVGIKKLGHLKKLGLAIKKLKDGRGSTTTAAGPCGRGAGGEMVKTVGPGGEVLVISVPTGHQQAPMAEVRPYCHLPPQQMSPRTQSPHHQMPMSTFQQPNSPRERSPAHQYQNGYDTFPRRSSTSSMNGCHGTVVLTEALVHNTSYPGGGGSMPHGGGHLRPMGAVKPRPVAKIVAETKRSSREFSGSDESLEKLKNYHNIIENGGGDCSWGSYHPLQGQGGPIEVLCESTDSGSYANYANFQTPMIGAAVYSESMGCDGLVRTIDNRKINRLAGQTRRKPVPPVPPKRCPLQGADGGPPFLVSVPHLSEQTILNESFSGLSPAPSMDDLPPPPAPPSITCEESIRNLRSIMTSSTESATTNQNRRLGNRSSDSASCSSTECLPFANENVGTIKSRHHSPQVNGATPGEAGENLSVPSTPRRTNVKDVFPPNLNLEEKTVQSAQVTRFQSGQNGDVLTDIGSMLQNLTDELDLMLVDSTNRSPRAVSTNKQQQ